MRYLILSDIHANIDAFETVLEHAAGRWDRALVLGDLVGYGAEPNAVVDRVRELNPEAVIRGNHDKAACGIDDGSQFNHVARMAAMWTGRQMTPDNMAYLRALPMGPVQIDALTEICHGTPFDEDAYVFDDLDALRAMHAARRPLCLFGHTHVQVGHYLSRDEFGLASVDDTRPLSIALEESNRYLVNPGSVGQPRDGDPRAGFGIVDTTAREVTLYRVEYPIAKAQARIMQEGLPDVLAQRLALGR
jgi:diadenosine tetraphosphatase ApaH/serine/threonine PP2A family protein phosphatase